MKSFFRISGEIVLELIWLIFYAAAGFVLLYAVRTNKQEAENGRTIVIVERWLNKNRMHQYWVEYLRKKGFRTYFVHLSFLKGSFQQSARELRDFIEKEQLRDITLVGISSGGVACLEYVEKYNGWESVKNFITLGSPLRGAPLSCFLFFIRPTRELLPSSSFMKHFAQGGIQYPQRVTCFVAALDELVPVWSSSVPEATKQNIPVYGHNNLHLFCKKTYDEIARIALNRG